MIGGGIVAPEQMSLPLPLLVKQTPEESTMPTIAEHALVLADTRATSTSIDVRVDAGEHLRRRSYGLGALTGRTRLADLLELPVGLGVPVGRLPGDTQSRLRRCPPGVVNEDRGEFIRLLVRPCTVTHIVVTAETWRAALPVLDRYAPFAQRHVALPRGEAIDPYVCYAAERFGIGVRDHDGEQIIEAETFVVRRFSAVGWSFVERMYERVLDAR